MENSTSDSNKFGNHIFSPIIFKIIDSVFQLEDSGVENWFTVGNLEASTGFQSNESSKTGSVVSWFQGSPSPASSKPGGKAGTAVITI
jgi:hypothetical protein